MAGKKTTKVELTLLEQIKNDGYVDIAKKIGTGKNGNAGFSLQLADDATIASLYVGNGLTKRIIDLLVDDMTRQWITIPEDTDGELLKYLKKLKAKTEFKGALRTAKLFGGSIIFMVIDDGGLPNDPVNVNNIKSIKKLKFFSRKYVTIDANNYYKDVLSENFGEPEYFTVNVDGQLLTLHESRCLVFKGEYYPREEMMLNVSYEKYWGLSILQSLHEVLQDYGLAQQALLRLLTKSNVDVLKIKNLFQLLKNKDGQKQLDARAQIFDLAKSVSTTLLLDIDEAYETVSQAMTGVSETFSKVESSVAGMTGIPGNILFGTPTKGLNSTGDNEMRIYYDKVKSDQEEEMSPQLDKLIAYMKMAKDSKLDATEDYCHEFNSLWQQTDAEKVDMRYKQAQTDEIYINTGVYDPDEVRASRFGEGNYSIETHVEGDAPELPEYPTKPMIGKDGKSAA